MTLDEYYQQLKVLWEKVDKNNLESIKAYNRAKVELRKEIKDAEDN